MQSARKDGRTAEAWREWLKRLPTLTGKSLTGIAHDIGVAPSTLTRPLHPDDPGTSTPNQRTIDKIVARYKVVPPDFEGRAPAAPARRPLRAFFEDAVTYQPGNDETLTSAVRALIAGRNNADPWVIRSRSLELAGYLPGDIIIVELGATPQIGDIVCAQTNIDLHRGTAETVMRIYERAGATDVLVAASMDPMMRQPIALDHRAEIRGVVVGMVRPMDRDRAA